MGVGKHIAYLEDINFRSLPKYGGYMATLKWVNTGGAEFTANLTFSDNPRTSWLTPKHTGFVQTILEAAGMEGEASPDWSEVAEELKGVRFSIELRRSSDGRYTNLNDVAVIDNREARREVEDEPDDDDPGQDPIEPEDHDEDGDDDGVDASGFSTDVDL
jgi:hypothetical protein